MYTAKPIIPEPINIAALEKAIQAAGDEISKEIAKDYGPSVAQADFSNPVPATEKHPSKYKWTIEVVSKKFNYVDFGVKPHKIKAKRAKYLKFQTGYKRKTRKGRIRSRPGGPSGGVAYAKEIKHPGFEGAEITESINDLHFKGGLAVNVADREIAKAIG